MILFITTAVKTSKPTLIIQPAWLAIILSNILAFLGDLGQFLLGKPKALVVVIRISVKFQYLGFFLRTSDLTG
jgi:hypothetical protein